MTPPPANRDSKFPTTHWTLIHRVQAGNEEDAAHAMEEICRQYWFPIYAFARRSGLGAAEAEDATQTFFLEVLADESLQAARREKGRMRTFMLAMLKRSLGHQFRHESAEKRGGGRSATSSWDELTAEERYQHEPAEIIEPEKMFDRAWAEEVHEQAVNRLRAEFEEGENLPLFEAIRNYLPFHPAPAPYAEVAERFGMKEATARQQVSRMRKRYGKLLEEQIAQTADGEDEVKAELAYLMAILSA